MKATLKYVSMYYVLLVLIATGLLVSLKRHSQSFNVDSIQNAITPSKRMKVSDPCQYQVLGDPASTEWIKVWIYCSSDKKAVTTIDARVFEEQEITPRLVLEKAAELNHFELSVQDGQITGMGELVNNSTVRWDCDFGQGNEDIQSIDLPIEKIPLSIKCTYGMD